MFNLHLKANFKNKMQLANFHAHSNFSDGEQSPEIYLQNAIRQGLKAYGFADHAPIPIDDFGAMTEDSLPAYLATIDQLRENFSDQIQVYKSLEVDYIPDVISVDSDHILAAQLDYTVGAVHYVDYLKNGLPWGFEGSIANFEKGLKEIFQGDIQACISRYYALIRQMVRQHCPDIIAHLDRIKKLNVDQRYFKETELWYRKEVIQTLELIATSGAIMEINTKGYYKGEIMETYPGKWVLEIAREMNIPLHLSSDAHHPDDITKGFNFATEILKSINIETVFILWNGRWKEVALEDRSAMV